MSEAKRDQNRITTLLGTSNADGVTPVVLWADPTTHRLLVDVPGGGSGSVTEVDTGTGLTGGPINVSGTIELNTKLAPMDTLTGNSLKYLRVNAGETAVEWATVSGGTITGLDTEVLFFDGDNNPAGDADLVWDKTLNTLTIGSYGNLNGSAGLTINENTSGSYIDMDTVGDIRVVSDSGHIVLDSGISHLVQVKSIGTYAAVFDTSRLSTARYVAFPDIDGTIQLTRSKSVVSSPTAAGSDPSTDYVYLVSGNTTITLPSAVGNNNLYTIKNAGSDVVTIATVSAQTIDGASTYTLNVPYAVDLISDGSNWFIV